MVTWFYFIVFVLALVMTGRFLASNKNVDSLFILFGITVTLNCLGRYLTAASQGLEMALCANIILYIGACYAPLLTVMVLSRLCEVRIPKVLTILMVAYSTIVLCLVITIGKCGIYYKNVELAHGNGYSYLVKEYGPAHNLYPVMMVMYAVVMIFYIVLAFRKRKQISFRTVSTISITCFAVILMYILERVTKSSVSFLAIGYLVGIALLTKYYERISMYDMSANIVSSIEKNNKYGYIVFDDRYRYVNSNWVAKELFPEINTWNVDSDVPVSDTYVYKEIVHFLKHWDGREIVDKYVDVNDSHYQLDIRILSHGNRKNVGYLLELTDRTLEKKYYNTIEEYNASLENQVSEKTENILHIKDMMVLGMAEMVESRDNNTGGHIKRTSDVVKVFSDKLKEYTGSLGVDEKFLQMVKKAAPMHDLGKIAIDDVILRKPGKYTDEEYAQMKRHPVEGARIVENILDGVEDDEFVKIAKNVALYHHEKWNGKGYPYGLAGTDIPLEARIMALADVFDALVSKRCYKEAFSYDKAFSIIEESTGEHFDPLLGKVFLKCRPQLEKLYDGYQ
ncbi:MAG: HD domain-containing phosphohydrolase [Lachnospira sp.]